MAGRRILPSMTRLESSRARRPASPATVAVSLDAASEEQFHAPKAEVARAGRSVPGESEVGRLSRDINARHCEHAVDVAQLVVQARDEDRVGLGELVV